LGSCGTPEAGCPEVANKTHQESVEQPDPIVAPNPPQSARDAAATPPAAAPADAPAEEYAGPQETSEQQLKRQRWIEERRAQGWITDEALYIQGFDAGFSVPARHWKDASGKLQYVIGHYDGMDARDEAYPPADRGRLGKAHPPSKWPSGSDQLTSGSASPLERLRSWLRYRMKEDQIKDRSAYIRGFVAQYGFSGLLDSFAPDYNMGSMDAKQAQSRPYPQMPREQPGLNTRP
jgi:hypothetical protein